MGSGKGGGGGSSHTTTTTKPWKGQRPYLKDVFSQADKLYESGQLAPAYYPGNTVAPMDKATQQALSLQEKRAQTGSQAMTAAQNQLTQTMSGNYLESNPFTNATNPYEKATNPYANVANPFTNATNPYENADNPFMNTKGNPQLDAMVQRAIGQSNAGVNGNFAAAGRYGSGAHAAALNDAAGNIATQMYGQAYDQEQNRALESWNANQNRSAEAWNANQQRTANAWNSNQNRSYAGWNANQDRSANAWNANQQRASDVWNTERDNQTKGMMFAPQLASADYQDIAALSEVGTARENYAQEKINADIERYNYNANRKAQGLQNYANLIQGNYGMSGSSSATGSARSNPLGGAMSGAMSGAGIGMAAKASTPLTLGLAGVGGLLGLI